MSSTSSALLDVCTDGMSDTATPRLSEVRQQLNHTELRGTTFTHDARLYTYFRAVSLPLGNLKLELGNMLCNAQTHTHTDTQAHTQTHTDTHTQTLLRQSAWSRRPNTRPRTLLLCKLALRVQQQSEVVFGRSGTRSRLCVLRV